MKYPHSIYLDFYEIVPPANAHGLANMQKNSLAVINAGDELVFGTPVMLNHKVSLKDAGDFSLEGYILLEGKTRLNIRHEVALPADLIARGHYQLGLTMVDANTADLVIKEEQSIRRWTIPLGDLFPDGLYE